MKNQSQNLSAHEINRFIYCPYQWYYTRYYGTRDLQARYKALDRPSGEAESNFSKGHKFHKNYYKSYRLKSFLQYILFVLGIGLILWVVMRWQ